MISYAVSLDPHCVLANVLMADYCIANEEYTQAKHYLHQARLIRKHSMEQSLASSASSSASAASSTALTQREHLYVIAWLEWLKGKKHALATLSYLLTLYPSDLFAVKKAQLIAFLQGDFARMLMIVQHPAVVAACQSLPYYHGMLAFALEENHYIVEAEQAARHGLSVNAHDVWCTHAVAHCLLSRGAIKEGIQWMHEHEHQWQHCMSFMYTHAWFHTSLFYLLDEQFHQVQRIFATHIWRMNAHAAAASVADADADDSADEEKKSSSASSDQTHALAPPPGMSVSPLHKPFALQDKQKAEDQMNALIILWKWELRCTGAASGDTSDHVAASTTAASFDGYYDDLLRHIAWPSPHSLGLFGLLLLHALARSSTSAQQQQHHQRAQQLLQQIHQNINEMKSEAGSRKKLKYQQLYAPLAEAIYVWATIEYKGTAASASTSAPADKAYALAHGVMSPYQHYIHEQHVAHQQRSSSSASSPSKEHSATQTSTSASASSLNGRHVIQVVGGSGEQRSVLGDWWLELLISTGHFTQAQEEIHRGYDARKEGMHYLQRLLILTTTTTTASSPSIPAAAIPSTAANS